MSVYRISAVVAGLICCAAVVTALAGVGPGAPAVPVKGDRLDATGIPACSPEPWPYGCQWRTPVSRRTARRP
jgi:hypothetical protein